VSLIENGVNPEALVVGETNSILIVYLTLYKNAIKELRAETQERAPESGISE
jgi:hypothetical protein